MVFQIFIALLSDLLNRLKKSQKYAAGKLMVEWQKAKQVTIDNGTCMN